MLLIEPAKPLVLPDLESPHKSFTEAPRRRITELTLTDEIAILACQGYCEGWTEKKEVESTTQFTIAQFIQKLEEDKNIQIDWGTPSRKITDVLLENKAVPEDSNTRIKVRVRTDQAQEHKAFLEVKVKTVEGNVKKSTEYIKEFDDPKEILQYLVNHGWIISEERTKWRASVGISINSVKEGIAERVRATLDFCAHSWDSTKIHPLPFELDIEAKNSSDIEKVAEALGIPKSKLTSDSFEQRQYKQRKLESLLLTDAQRS
jgi:hypothetical protein